MLHQGKLKAWDPQKGSGFIQQDKAGPDIRINSSGFRKKPEQLQDGDSIFFQIEVDAQGKAKAVSAYKAGQHFAPAPAIQKPVVPSLPLQRLLSVMVSLFILAWLGYQSFYLFSTEDALPVVVQTAIEEQPQQELAFAEDPVWPPLRIQQGEQFQCEGKQHCSEMSSCEEAEFYLEHCPGVLMDGDHDGIPCENQLCKNRWF